MAFEPQALALVASKLQALALVASKPQELAPSRQRIPESVEPWTHILSRADSLSRDPTGALQASYIVPFRVTQSVPGAVGLVDYHLAYFVSARLAKSSSGRFQLISRSSRLAL